ncbi:MAG TPA: hypothetical protein VHP14_03940 [Anaerolineales bacterium]|nr:hypothetical protein [Anaerolineales bacterium]
MVTTLNPIQTNILGATLIELLNGELSDETIAAVDSIKREDIPEPLRNLVGWIHGMTTQPELRESNITSLIDEIRVASIEVLEKRREHPNAIGVDWISMYALLQHILGGSNPDTSLRANINAGMLPKTEQAPGWAKPLIQHAQASPGDDQQLTLELLDVLENIIRKRRAELTK